MANKIEVSIDVILHATEDTQKFFDVFEEDFGLKEKTFSIQELTGHFDNPITMLNAKIVKKEAIEFVRKIASKLEKSQLDELLENIEEFVANSTLHLRFDKQKFLIGKLLLIEKNPIKIKIFTPIYNKKETGKIYSELLIAN